MGHVQIDIPSKYILQGSDEFNRILNSPIEIGFGDVNYFDNSTKKLHLSLFTSTLSHESTMCP